MVEEQMQHFLALEEECEGEIISTQDIQVQQKQIEKLEIIALVERQLGRGNVWEKSLSSLHFCFRIGSY